jgi:glycosyltransferase involved in cell wall biosynthesis
MRSRRDVVFFAPYAGPLLAARAGVDGGGSAGGAETQLFLVARALARRGRRVALAVFDRGDGLPGEVDGVEVIRLPVPSAGAAARSRFVALLLRRLDADVLVQRAAGSHTGMVGLLARVRRRRFVYSSASDFDFDPEFLAHDRNARRLFPLGIRCASAIVVQTDAQAALCRREWGRSCAVIRSIAEPAARRASSPEAFLWIGRTAPYKRPDAFLALAARLPEAQFWMVGGESALDPALQARIRAQAAGLPNLRLLPPRPREELAALLERAVAVVSTSVAEGMPNVFLEGWARGVPALALAHDPDGVVQRHGLGWFADGSPERLAEQATLAWETRDDQAALSSRCREYVGAEHAAEQVAARWEQALGLSARAG